MEFTMTMPHAIFLGMLLIAIATFASGRKETLISTAALAADSDEEASGKGIWAFRGHGEQLTIWKMNTRTGELYACAQKTKSCERVGAN
jgi:hypothetical protein